MQQPRFRPKRIPEFSRKLVIGTSRTKYIDPRTVGSSIHSFRGATLVDLHETLKHYESKKLESVTVIAGFNDHRANRHEIVYRWQKLIELIVEKFNPKSLIIPKTIGTALNSHINNKIHMFNSVLFNLVANFHHPYVRIFSPLLNLPLNFFCRDGVHFSFHGNKVFSMLLCQMMHMAQFYR